MTIYIFSAIFLYIIVGILLFFIQRKILFNKSNKPNKPEEYGLKEVKEVFIETSDNEPDLLDIDFECSSPFGEEMLIAVGRNRPFDRLESREENGYFYVEVDDPSQLASLTRGTRGFKRRKRKDQSVEQTEDKLIITTVPFNF